MRSRVEEDTASCVLKNEIRIVNVLPSLDEIVLNEDVFVDTFGSLANGVAEMGPRRNFPRKNGPRRDRSDKF